METPSLPIAWQTLEFEQKDRHPDWVWYIGLIFGIAAIISFFYGNVFFGIFLVIAGVVVIIYAFREPRMLAISLSDDGLTINDATLEYKQLKRFWLDETAKPDKLLLQVQGSFVPVIALSLSDVSAEAVRERLKAHEIPEEEMRESLSVKIFERIGF